MKLDFLNALQPNNRVNAEADMRIYFSYKPDFLIFYLEKYQVYRKIAEIISVLNTYTPFPFPIPHSFLCLSTEEMNGMHPLEILCSCFIEEIIGRKEMIFSWTQ